MTDIRIDSYRPRHGESAHEKALTQLRANLTRFAFDGLVQLAEDLREGRVLRGVWARDDSGCVISYRLGEAGSASSATPGTEAWGFISLWDGKWLRAPAVLREVEAEIARRRPAPVEVPEATPAEVETAKSPALCPVS